MREAQGSFRMNTSFTMKPLCILLGLCWLARVATAAPLSETWRTGYTGEDVKGAHVLACWQFKPGAEMEDSSSHANRLRPAGAVTAAQGRFDGALESFPGWPVQDKRHAAIADSGAPLSPKGAFTIEMWIKPKA